MGLVVHISQRIKRSRSSLILDPRLISILLLSYCMAFPDFTWALPDSEVQKLIKADQTFAYVEKTLLDTWAAAPKDFKRKYRSGQLGNVVMRLIKMNFSGILSLSSI